MFCCFPLCAVFAIAFCYSVELVPCTSSPFLVIRYKLLIDHDKTKMPAEWYKDQGGQHKHMTLSVFLTDTTENIVKPRGGIIHLVLRSVSIMTPSDFADESILRIST